MKRFLQFYVASLCTTQVKRDIQNLRINLTERIWLLSDDALVLRENDWMANVSKHLANFEKQILTAIKADGWDGDEDVRKSQWTFAGSLFYSIIVITTIGECVNKVVSLFALN